MSLCARGFDILPSFRSDPTASIRHRRRLICLYRGRRPPDKGPHRLIMILTPDLLPVGFLLQEAALLSI